MRRARRRIRVVASLVIPAPSIIEERGPGPQRLRHLPAPRQVDLAQLLLQLVDAMERAARLAELLLQPPDGRARRLQLAGAEAVLDLALVGGLLHLLEQRLGLAVSRGQLVEIVALERQPSLEAGGAF